METYLNNPHLNEQQLDMIRLLRKPLPREDFIQIKRLAVQLMGKQLEDMMGKWEEDNNITEADYEVISKEQQKKQEISRNNIAKLKGALKLSNEQCQDFQQHAKDIRNEWQGRI